MSDKVNRREQVKELIQAGKYTKAQIAEALEVNPASVSSQMTYLRWMGNFIVADESKVLRFVTEDEYAAHQAIAQANKKVKTGAAAKDPQTRANELAKTITKQVSQLTKMQAKLDQVLADINEDPDDEDLQELMEEASANVTLMQIKIKRNKALAATLPEPVETDDEVSESEDNDEDDLL